MPEIEPTVQQEPTIDLLLEACKEILSAEAISDIVDNQLNYEEAIGFLFSYLPEVGVDPVEFLAEKGLLE